jgi:DNA repair protein RecO
MSERNQVHEVILLRTHESPAGDRIATFLSGDSGLIDAFIFGGAKSSLRTSATPYIHGKVFLYIDPVKNYRKLTDMVIDEPFQGLRESYSRSWAASVLAEFLIRTSACGGEYAQVFDLSIEALRFLDNADEEGTIACVLVLLWKLTEAMGLKPDTRNCAQCGAFFGREPLSKGQEKARAYYSRERDGFICSACAHNENSGNLLPIDLAMIEWFDHASEDTLENASATSLTSFTKDKLVKLIFALAQKSAEGPLLTLDYRL